MNQLLFLSVSLLFPKDMGLLQLTELYNIDKEGLREVGEQGVQGSEWEIVDKNLYKMHRIDERRVELVLLRLHSSSSMSTQSQWDY
jgi:hypothetical protein